MGTNLDEHDTAALGVVAPRIGRYEVIRELGHGMMGVVYEARDPLLARSVALKTLQPGFLVPAGERERLEQRFLAEARAVARLGHHGIVAVHDVGRDGDVLFIAFDLIAGRTLADLVHGRGRLPWPTAARLVRSLARALAHAHERGIVHRDVKPENVMVTEDGEPVLMDFGIARADVARLTATGEVFGTPRYMAPEQVLGAEVDGRADIFALGALAYLVLTGRHAFDARGAGRVLRQVVHEQPASPAELVPGLPPALGALVMRALAKDPAVRFSRADEIADDIERILAQPDASVAVMPEEWLELAEEPAVPLRGLPPSPSGETHDVHTVGPAPRRWPMRTGIAIAAVLAGIAAFVSTRTGVADTRLPPELGMAGLARATASARVVPVHRHEPRGRPDASVGSVAARRAVPTAVRGRAYARVVPADQRRVAAPHGETRGHARGTAGGLSP